MDLTVTLWLIGIGVVTCLINLKIVSWYESLKK